MVHLHQTAAQHESPTRYFRELREAVPAHARVLARPNHWPALMTNDFRNFVLPFYLSMGSISETPISFYTALEDISPDVIILDEPLMQMFQDRSALAADEWTAAFWRYMQQHNARLAHTMKDNWGAHLEIYQLTQP
jgi:hypothetical protein